MKINQQLFQINRNFLICFIVSASLSAFVAQIFSDFENYQITTITIIAGYIVFFGIFGTLFYFDNKKRFKGMERKSVKNELIKLISSFGIGEIFYLMARFSSLYYFLEIEIEPFAASLISEILSTLFYMIIVTTFLRVTRTY